jgi:CBS-domain-containing membrane protein/PII-like signaling protein
MEPTDTAQQVWIFLNESDRWHGGPLSVAILELLQREGIAGATALRGIAGYGAHGQIHTATLVELASDLPIVVTFVDRADRVARVLPEVAVLAPHALVSVSPALVFTSGHRAPGPFPAHLVVADVMTRDVARVRPDSLIGEVVVLLIDRALRALPVVDSGEHVIGIITDGDLLARGGTSLSVGLLRALPAPDRPPTPGDSARDVMTPNPATLAAATPLAQAAAAMANHNRKRLPVVDAEGRLVGMVSRSDLLKTVAEGLRQQPAQPLALPAGAPATVAAIMMRDVPTVHRDTPLAEALDSLLETEKRRVVVVDDDEHVVGIITDGDVIQRAARRVRPGALRALAAWFGGGSRPEGLEVVARGRTAADIMTSPVITIRAETPVAEAIQLMMAHRIKRLPVVDAEGRLIGLLGRAGVLAALSHTAS